jgi:hypothetical protein
MKLLFMRNALILSVPFVFCGCSLKAQTDAFKPQIDPSYTVEAHMEYADNAADVTVTRYSAGVWDAEFSAPAALAGVLLRFDGNAVSASYQGLQFSVPKSAMPAKTMLIAVTDVLDSFEGMEALPCTEQEDGTWQNAGTHDAGHYTVTFDPSGTIADMEFPDQPLKMTFRNYHCTAAQTTAPAGTAFTSAGNTQTAAVSSASSAKS